MAHELAASVLPEAFDDLEPFVAKWCLDNNSERYMARISSSMNEIQSVYDAIQPRLDAAMDWLNRKPLDELEGADVKLLKLCLAMGEVALSVEVYKTPELRLASPPGSFVVSTSGLQIE